ncbi:unnamed protein product [Rhizoctonia solani]|uniref:Uncharacterized protein n=1 Tax=Rhizoctonia solani TaxID=456999 RepID=A0A8H3A768_9AGAM|nr:unnamed protein product [Rhizoctonia solani]
MFVTLLVPRSPCPLSQGWSYLACLATTSDTATTHVGLAAGSSSPAPESATTTCFRTPLSPSMRSFSPVPRWLRAPLPLPLRDAAVVQCWAVRLSWSGGTATYFHSVIAGQQAGAAALKEFPSQTGTLLIWTVNLVANTHITIQVRDSTGSVQYSPAVFIQNSTDSSCVNSNVSATAFGGSTTTGSSGATSATASATTPAGSASARLLAAAAVLPHPLVLPLRPHQPPAAPTLHLRSPREPLVSLVSPALLALLSSRRTRHAVIRSF